MTQPQRTLQTRQQDRPLIRLSHKPGAQVIDDVAVTWPGECALSPWPRATPAEAAGHFRWAGSHKVPKWQLVVSFTTVVSAMGPCLMSRLTVMICALSSAERVNEFGFALNSLWKACMALAVTSYARQAEQADEKNKLGRTWLHFWMFMFSPHGWVSSLAAESRNRIWQLPEETSPLAPSGGPAHEVWWCPLCCLREAVKNRLKFAVQPKRGICKQAQADLLHAPSLWCRI